MNDNVARDLFTLAAHAFNRKDYEVTGQLIALSLSNPDAGEFIDSLMQQSSTCGILAESMSQVVHDDMDEIGKAIAKSTSNSTLVAQRKSLRSDHEDFDDITSQSLDEVDAEEKENVASVSSTRSVSSPLKIVFK